MNLRLVPFGRSDCHEKHHPLHLRGHLATPSLPPADDILDIGQIGAPLPWPRLFLNCGV